MGYKSEVAITLKNDDFDTLVKKAKNEHEDAYGLIKMASVYKTEKFTTLHFDFVKWYADYEDVRFIETFMRSVPYVFNRVGDDCNDIEVLENCAADFEMFQCVSVITGLDVGNAGELISLQTEEGTYHVNS